MAHLRKGGRGSGSDSGPLVPPTRESYLKLAEEVEATLQRDVLGVWFPRALDVKNGGFVSDFTREWQPASSGGKFSVFQGRMTWISAQISMRRPKLKDLFLPFARHGLEFLDNFMWDKECGGFFWGLDDRGNVSNIYGDNKHLYGMSFCIYGLAAAYQATGEQRALQFAQEAFRWIDEHAHDQGNGGYFEWLKRDGGPIPRQQESSRIELSKLSPFPIGYKSMNTHIHILESFLQLYEIWNNARLEERLKEILAIVEDKICVEPGAMNLYFTNEWKALPGHDSYGHDLEAAYLLLDAEDKLHREGDFKKKTEQIAKMLVDHALNYGWDKTKGGFFREGTAFGKPEDKVKEWWVQVEGLNALLIMHRLYGKRTEMYFQDFQRQWQFIKNYQTDDQFGGLYEMVSEDGDPIVRGKGRIWKAAYHDGRAFLNVSERLQILAEIQA